MADIVREMMKQQHKAMFIALRDGKFNPIIDGAEAVSPSTQAFPAAAPVAAPPSAPSAPSAAAMAPTEAPPKMPSGILAAQAAERARAAEKAAQVAARNALATAPTALRTPAAQVPAAREAEEAVPQTLRLPPDELTLDIDAVERAAAAASTTAPALRASADLPPPPASLFRDKGSMGKYRVTAPAPDPRGGGPTPAAGRPPSSSPMPAAAVARGPGGERRYAPTRPASIFGQARPQHGKSIFGEDLISDKSLDEVILSYLAEDLEADKK
jgi:hypothetical protein